MGKIKSAWEIALEKTEDIVIDTDKIRHDQKIDRIRRIAGAYLINEDADKESLKKDLKDFSQNELREALSLSIQNGLTLPSEEVTDNRYEKLKALFDIALNTSEYDALFDQITDLQKQYPKHKKQLFEQMQKQFEPMLREKEEQMKERYGREIHLTLENDKEFAEVVRQNLDKLEGQYQQALDNAKAQLLSLFRT